MKHSDPFKDSYDINESLSSLRTKLKILKNAYIKEKQEKETTLKENSQLKEQIQSLQQQVEEKVNSISRIIKIKNYTPISKNWKKNFWMNEFSSM